MTTDEEKGRGKGSAGCLPGFIVATIGAIVGGCFAGVASGTTPTDYNPLDSLIAGVIVGFVIGGFMGLLLWGWISVLREDDP